MKWILMFERHGLVIQADVIGIIARIENILRVNKADVSQLLVFLQWILDSLGILRGRVVIHH